MRSFVVGIDGGGSKTRALLVDERGERIAEATGPGSAARPNEIEHSAGVIAGVVRDLLEKAEAAEQKPRVLCVGVAGVGRESERQALWEALIAQQIAEEIVVQTDFGV